MANWMFDSLDRLDAAVLTDEPAVVGVRKKVADKKKTGVFKAAAFTVLLCATASPVVCTTLPTVSSSVVRVSFDAAQHNVEMVKPPLEAFFSDRFDESWTREHENVLLFDANKARDQFSKRLTEQQRADFLRSMEDERLDASKLSDKEIRELLSRRKA